MHYYTSTSNLSTYGLRDSDGKSSIQVGFPLRCCGYPVRTQLPSDAPGGTLVHQRYVHPGPLVLGTNPVKFPTRMNRTELSHDVLNPARTAQLANSQTLGTFSAGWWATSSAKHPRRYGLLGGISLLSPACLLSVERWPFHSEPPITMTVFRLCSTCTSRSQAGLCHCTLAGSDSLSLPSRASVTLWEATAPVKLPTMGSSWWWWLDVKIKGGVSSLTPLKPAP